MSKIQMVSKSAISSAVRPPIFGGPPMLPLPFLFLLSPHLSAFQMHRACIFVHSIKSHDYLACAHTCAGTSLKRHR